LHSHLDHAEEFVLQGWAAQEDAPGVTVSLDILINHQLIARVPARTFRGDLKAAGYGDGHHAFFFNPFDYLFTSQNLLEVRESSSNELLANGSRTIHTQLATNGKDYRNASARSQLRWALQDDSNAAEGETAFLSHLEKAVRFHPALRILELGAGQGRLHEQLVERNRPFHSYLGLDLSRPAVESLHARFASERTRFLTGDAARYPLIGSFDLAIASSLCDAVFPSFLPLLHNVGRVLAPGGLICFDLVVQDDRNSISRAGWNSDRYLRLYSEAELRRLLAQAGLELLETVIYTKTAGEHRVFVTAFKGQPTPHNHFERA